MDPENDIRCQVTKRKVSGGTRSDTGRDCRDAFLSLNKTYAKLRIAFWDYLGVRLAGQIDFIIDQASNSMNQVAAARSRRMP
jgi:hypothetical protein